MQKQIDTLEIQNKVFLMGATSDVGKALQTADLFVLSSDYEGMPNALMEAMAVGVPCLSTDCPCGGPRELIKNEKEGILVPVGNVNVMENAISSILNNRDKLDEMGLNAKCRADFFKPNVILKEWKEYIEFINNTNFKEE